MKRFVNVYQYLVPLLVLVALPMHGIRLFAFVTISAV